MATPYSLLSHTTDLATEIEHFYYWYASWEKDAVILSIGLQLLSQMLSLLNISQAQGEFIKKEEKQTLLSLFWQMKESLHDQSLNAEELPSFLLSLYEVTLKDNPHARLAWVLINLQEQAYTENLWAINALIKQISPALPQTRAQVIYANVEKISKLPLVYNSLPTALQDATQGWLP